MNALDPSRVRAKSRPSLVSYWPTLNAELGTESAYRKHGRVIRDGHKGGRGTRRVYTKKALVLIAMRARTPTADAFRHWLAENAAAAADAYRAEAAAALGLADNLGAADEA